MTNDRNPKIVVGVDGSEGSKRALRWALDEAALRGDRLEVICAWTFPPYFGTPGLVLPPDAVTPADAAQMTLTELVAQVAGPEPSVEIQTVAVEGGAARVLIDHASDASLLVVGNRGHGAVAGALLGSVRLACA